MSKFEKLYRMLPEDAKKMVEEIKEISDGKWETITTIKKTPRGDLIDVYCDFGRMSVAKCEHPCCRTCDDDWDDRNALRKMLNKYISDVMIEEHKRT